VYTVLAFACVLCSDDLMQPVVPHSLRLQGILVGECHNNSSALFLRASGV
jgi:hypothetical protein